MELKVISLYVFTIFSVLHIIVLFFKMNPIQAISKSILMPLLLIVYIFNAINIHWSIILALIFGCTGDIFLLKITNILRFRLGLACFLLGHLAYIIAFIDFAQPVNTKALAISFIAALVFGFIMYKFVHPNREMKIPVIVYETVITAMTVLSYQVFLNQRTPHGIFILIGSLLFLTSDSVLARFTFVKQPKYGHFLVMITYIAAQFCIVFGFCRL